MGITLKGIEIENFKSYTNKQYIRFSDLAVLLGANSSGKSTALQALLVLKQTMECNSPDEELLLSGKYVALGDFDDVIADSEKDFFSFSAVLEQTEKSENTQDGDSFKIKWMFKRDVDGISASLQCIDINFENIRLSLKKADKKIFDLYINENRSVFSVDIYNLMLSDYFVHYDTNLNSKASELINVLSQMLISQKTTTRAIGEPVGVDAIREFYFRLLNCVQDNEIEKMPLNEDIFNLATRVENLIDDFGSLELPTYSTISRMIPRDLRIKILELLFGNLDSIEKLETILGEYEMFVSEYKCSIPKISDLKGVYILGKDPFWLLDREDEKCNNLTQLKYALNFYNSFYTEIISRIFFVGPIRETPKGLYNIGFETVPKYVGPTGSYFASVLLHESKKEKEYILPRGKENCTLSDALAEWMVHLNVASAVNVDKKILLVLVFLLKIWNKSNRIL